MWHFFKGMRNSPRGQRFRGGLATARMRAPIIGGNFGVWGGVFSVFDCTLAYARKTEDAWNAIISGGLTGGVLAARAGTRAIVRNTIVGAIFLAVIEGGMLMLNKAIMKMQQDQLGNVAVDRLEPPIPPGYATRLATGEMELQLELR